MKLKNLILSLIAVACLGCSTLCCAVPNPLTLTIGKPYILKFENKKFKLIPVPLRFKVTEETLKNTRIVVDVFTGDGSIQSKRIVLNHPIVVPGPKAGLNVGDTISAIMIPDLKGCFYAQLTAIQPPSSPGARTKQNGDPQTITIKCSL